MKKDYLWDKTGSDPAIEKLEYTLRVFSFEENSRQMPAREIQPVERPRFFRFLSFGFAAAAACIAIAMILWIVSNRSSTVENLAADHERTTEVSPGPVEPAPSKADQKLPEVSQPVERRKLNRRAAPPVAIAAKSHRRKPVTEKLTKEEIYAYNRLMLALSITGDKLNLVREKINGE